jgi:hypothetical protein
MKYIEVEQLGKQTALMWLRTNCSFQMLYVREILSKLVQAARLKKRPKILSGGEAASQIQLTAQTHS